MLLKMIMIITSILALFISVVLTKFLVKNYFGKFKKNWKYSLNLFIGSIIFTALFMLSGIFLTILDNWVNFVDSDWPIFFMYEILFPVVSIILGGIIVIAFIVDIIKKKKKRKKKK